MPAHIDERNRELWSLALAPGIWAVHFLCSYATAAVFCAKAAGLGAPLFPVRLAIAIYTLLALAGAAAVGWFGWRRHRLPGGEAPHDDDTPEDRHRFLGLATVLLSGLSLVAIAYSAMAAVFTESCR
jgi:hypothetical protein